jgi:hypothetical protein
MNLPVVATPPIVKPVVMLGVTMVGELPKDVSEEAVTPEARVLPVIEAAGAAMAVLQENPVEVVHIKALAVVLQEGTAWPDGVVAVNAPSRVLAVCVASCALVAWPDMSLKAGCALVKAPVAAVYAVKNWLAVAVVLAGATAVQAVPALLRSPQTGVFAAHWPLLL